MCWDCKSLSTKKCKRVNLQWDLKWKRREMARETARAFVNTILSFFLIQRISFKLYRLAVSYDLRDLSLIDPEGVNRCSLWDQWLYGHCTATVSRSSCLSSTLSHWNLVKNYLASGYLLPLLIICAQFVGAERVCVAREPRWTCIGHGNASPSRSIGEASCKKYKTNDMCTWSLSCLLVVAQL